MPRFAGLARKRSDAPEAAMTEALSPYRLRWVVAQAVAEPLAGSCAKRSLNTAPPPGLSLTSTRP
jgi:hypothetical protein